MSPKARQAKGKARLAAYERLVAEAQSGEQRQGALALEIPFTQRLGDRVIEAENVSKGYGDRLLIEDLEFSIPPAAVVGIIGANGAGKTTLFRMITGSEQPDTGTVEIGATVDLAYVDQTRDQLDPLKTVYDEISGGVEFLRIGKREVNARAYVASLNFKGSDQQKRVGDLSGGERNRVHLGKMLRTGGNVILLDEPSNDLDVDTLRALEEAIEDFPGCVLVISHDRWFLDRIATHILAFEGNSQVRFFPGNYTEYEEYMRREFGDEATKPHQLKYKPLVRD
jgi:ATPase subunit of ABC transporter with duplicated ATPase domains